MDDMATISEEIAGLKESVSSFFTRNSTLQTELEGVKAKLTKADSDLITATSRITTLEASVNSKDQEITKLTAQIEGLNTAKAEAEAGKVAAEAKTVTTEASVEQRAGIKALAIEQKRGAVAPVKDEAQKDNPGATKTLADLKGRERFLASFKIAGNTN